ncbi:MAG TPA: hypothetical protein VNM22_05660 [Candidatus Limnocylindrales bacterium]|nr:hypothetical protein [Candidatus Limnocylindrales bacterium]
MTLQDILTTLGLVSVTALILALLGLALLKHRLRHLRLPPDAGLFETLRAVPLGLVVVLDLLDLSLDIFSAPISWAILSRLGLQGLRQVTLLEALIPGTQLIPTMTLAWLLARFSERARPSSAVQSDPGEEVKMDHNFFPSSIKRRKL